MGIRDSDPCESGLQNVTLTRVSQVLVRDSDTGESGWEYMTLTWVSQTGIT